MDAMTVNRNELRSVLTATLVVAAACCARVADADVYTWVDAKGNVNIGNLQPPEGARIVGVTRENPQAKAQAAAAREAARQDEVKALAQRVAELENKAQAAFDAPPPVVYAPAPVSYAPAPQPQVNVVVMPAPQPDETAAYAPYGCAWVGCPTWFPYAYPTAIFVAPSHGHHHDFHRPSHPIRATPPRVTRPSPRIPMANQSAGRGLRG